MADRTWVDMLKRQTGELVDLQDTHAEEFLRLLRETKANILERLATGEQGDLDAFMLRRTLAEAEAQIAVFSQKASLGYQSQQRDAVDTAVEHQAETIGRLSKTFDAQPFTVVLDAQKVLADPLQGLLANHFDSSVKRYGLDILNDIRRDLFVGMRTGSSLRDITSGIASKQGPFGEVGQAKAARIARTEISQAYGAASLKSGEQVAKKVPGMVKTWLHIGSFQCPVCNPLNGSARPMDGTWTIGSGLRKREIVGPPAHPHCFPAGTLVDTPEGPKPIESIREGDQVLGGLTGQPRRVTRTHVNDSPGSLVVARCGDTDVAVSGNHPILTARGWIAADDLKCGDYVFRHLRLETKPDGATGNAHNGPSGLAQGNVLGVVDRPLSLRLMPSAGVNLNGKPPPWHGEIEIVDTDGELRRYLDSDSTQGVDKKSLGGGWLNAGRLGGGVPQLLGLAPLASSDGGMSGSGDALAPFRGAVSVNVDLGLRESPPRDTVLPESLIKTGSTDAKSGGHVLDGQAVVPMQRAQHGRVKFNPLHVDTLMRMPHSGKVFNLSVEAEEAYVASGIVVHNCTCRLLFVRPKWRDAMKKLGYLEAQDPNAKPTL